MKITYDSSLDVLRIILSDASIAESDEEKAGLILDYAEDGTVVGMEILDASHHVTNPSAVDYSVIGTQPA